MANINDIVSYILKNKGGMTTMKLQKLVYYCQAWSLVWEERPLFLERIEAWANGPIIPELYNKHKGLFDVSEWHEGNPNNLSDSDKETIDEVLKYYGDKSSMWLSELTHKEDPWFEARKGLPLGFRGDSEITYASMIEYYNSLIG